MTNISRYFIVTLIFFNYFLCKTKAQKKNLVQRPDELRIAITTASPDYLEYGMQDYEDIVTLSYESEKDCIYVYDCIQTGVGSDPICAKDKYQKTLTSMCDMEFENCQRENAGRKDLFKFEHSGACRG